MSATLVNLVDPENPESLKPLIDGGTEGAFRTYSDNSLANSTNQVSRVRPVSSFQPSHHVMSALWTCSTSPLHFPSVQSPTHLAFLNIA